MGLRIALRGQVLTVTCDALTASIIARRTGRLADLASSCCMIGFLIHVIGRTAAGEWLDCGAGVLNRTQPSAKTSPGSNLDDRIQKPNFAGHMDRRDRGREGRRCPAAGQSGPLGGRGVAPRPMSPLNARGRARTRAAY
jgi:hypothetical protein